MKRNKIETILFLFVFCVVTSYLLYPRPKGCSACWQKFKNSLITIILPVEKADKNTYTISLKNLRKELEKARIGDKLNVELQLGKAKAIKMDSFFPACTQDRDNNAGEIQLHGESILPTS